MELSPRDGGHEAADAGARPQRRWFHRESISLAEVAVQIFSVVLGILLALGIDDWRNERATAQGVADAMRAVRTEIASNRSELARHHHHLIEVRDALTAKPAPAGETPRACNEYEGWTGTGTAILLDAAYQTAIATQAFSHMPFARAQAIAAAYGMQKTYLDYLGKILNVVLSGRAMSESSCAGILDELAHFADALDGTYAKALSAAAGSSAKS